MKLQPNPHCDVQEPPCGMCRECFLWSSAVKSTLEDVARDLEEQLGLGQPTGNSTWAMEFLRRRYRDAAKEVG